SAESYPLSLHDALPILNVGPFAVPRKPSQRFGTEGGTGLPVETGGGLAARAGRRLSQGTDRQHAGPGNRHPRRVQSSAPAPALRSEEHTSELQSRENLV